MSISHMAIFVNMAMVQKENMRENLILINKNSFKFQGQRRCHLISVLTEQKTKKRKLSREEKKNKETRL